MSMKSQALVLITVGMVTMATAAPFRNLGFEEAVTSSLTPVMNPTTPGEASGLTGDLLPGWRLSLDSTPVTTLGFNDSRILAVPRSTVASLVDVRLGPLAHGQFGLVLSLAPNTTQNYFLTQTGEVPLGAQQLTFQPLEGLFIANINGKDLLPLRQGFGDYVADISQYAGQAVELTIRPASGPGGRYALDSIAFVVPEPSTIALASLGACAMFSAWLSRRRITVKRRFK